MPRHAQIPTQIPFHANELMFFPCFPCFYNKELSYWVLGFNLSNTGRTYLFICFSLYSYIKKKKKSNITRGTMLER